MSWILLDTHAFLWFIMGDPALSPAARNAIETSDSDKLVSIVSLWEIGIKTVWGSCRL